MDRRHGMPLSRTTSKPGQGHGRWGKALSSAPPADSSAAVLASRAGRLREVSSRRDAEAAAYTLLTAISLSTSRSNLTR